MTSGPAFDLDGSAYLVKANGGVRNSQDIIYCNKVSTEPWFCMHHGDNLTGYVIRSKSNDGFNAFQSWELVMARLFL